MQLQDHTVNIVQENCKSLQRMVVVGKDQRVNLRQTLIIQLSEFKYKLEVLIEEQGKSKMALIFLAFTTRKKMIPFIEMGDSGGRKLARDWG